ncbi:hypothetical protein ONZ45_g14086 [Pleurotus djamor]|nr:hypothetical protein ONZ45_g14086 [Pleurotus djamor]
MHLTKWQTTGLAVVVYAAIFSAVVFTDKLPKASSRNQQGFDLAEAYADLHVIASHPHPYNSHAIDTVREYLLARVQNITDGVPYAHIHNDLLSNGSWVSRGFGMYFEGRNILVKIDGQAKGTSTVKGVLFSAHYDSVATSFGATDDGMGVVTLLQLIRHFVAHRPKRTVVFNINNGEEDGLNGAHVFLQHEWSRDVDTFLNLEGAASGGRPILFRATGSAALSSFTSGNVPHPHGNVISQDAFSRGVIRSRTDFFVYSEGGHMEGLDLAFYKGRSKYHTKYDSIPFTNGGKDSLWSMMEAARGAGAALANDESSRPKFEKPVYFDLLGHTMVLLPLTKMATISAALVLGPLSLIVLSVFRADADNASMQTRVLQWLKSTAQSSKFRASSRFWLALSAAVVVQTFLVLIYKRVNEYIVYSSPFLVLLSGTTSTYVVFAVLLKTAASSYASAEESTRTIELQVYILTWILLLVSTLAIKQAELGGVYVITIWNASSLVGCIWTRASEITSMSLNNAGRVEVCDGAASKTVHDVPSAQAYNPRSDEKVTQTTQLSLLARGVCPHVVIVLLGALPQTLADGNSPATAGGEWKMPEEFKIIGSLNQLRLFSRTRGRDFVVDLKATDSKTGLSGKVACEWAEYESGMIGMGDVDGARIPAYEEALNFLPRWAVLTKMDDGLVEVVQDFRAYLARIRDRSHPIIRSSPIHEMTILQVFVSAFSFRKWPTTVLVVLTYAAILSSVLVTDELPDIPENQKGLDVDQAYTDLRMITAHPHPYNSHANDDVRSYILGRVKDITKEIPFAHIDDDTISNGSWVSRGYGVYFEGTNVLVKIDGWDNKHHSSGGVLFSAHYDSVSSASGVTDDGMGVVTLLQLVEYFSKNRPKRTVVFNINNGEEDWLNGAHAFLQHHWSTIVDTFLNLEGAASGGRPILFRATGTSPLLSFTSGNVPHPHGSVISADAFARGVIRSGTDYSVYADGARMQGLDLAFYKGRSKYHTKYDSIPFTDGGKKSLWSMMETARGAGIALANNDKTHSSRFDTPVYFDLFGSTMIAFPLTTLTTINIVALVLGPVMIILLAACEYIIKFNTIQGHQNGHVPVPEGSFWRDAWEWFKSMRWLSGFWKWAKFWLALGVTSGFQVLLVTLYVQVNRYVVYSYPYVVLASSVALAYLTFTAVLNIPIRLDGRLLPEQQKHTTLLQLYILTWFLLLLSTVAIKKVDVGGVYSATVWNSLAWLGCVISGIEDMIGARGTAVWELHNQEARRSHFVRGVRYDAVGQDEEPEHEAREIETDPTEITPLIAQQRSAPRTSSDDEERGAIGWWIIQLLVVLPIPLILLSHLAVILLGALPQTLADGSSAMTVYAALSFISTLLILPLTPFMIKTHRSLTYLLLVVFAAATIFTLLAFPFSLESPLKLFFQQRVALDSSTTKVVTSLSGVPVYIKSIVTSALPSAMGQEVTCGPDAEKEGLTKCSWESRLTPSPGVDLYNRHPWIILNTSRSDGASARITLGSHISEYHVVGGDPELQRGYEGEGLLEQLRLWSRSWDRQFEVDIKSPEGVDAIVGKVACEWAEYASGMVGMEGVDGAKIPAYEELLSFLPKWTVVTKLADGLVEVTKEFQV